MVEATGLTKPLRRRHLQWHDLSAASHENLPTGSKVISGGHSRTDRQHGDLISLI
jgi:hypothetical protein